MYTLPEDCTVERAAEIKSSLEALVTADAVVELDGSGVSRADVSFFQIVHCLNAELASKGGRLSLLDPEGVLLSGAREMGLGAWIAGFVQQEEN